VEMLRHVPEYAQQHIKKLCTYPDDHLFIHCVPEFYVDDEGVIYEAMPGCLRLPTSPGQFHFTLQPGHHFDRSAHYYCPCGNDRLYIFYSDFFFDTSAKCPLCGYEEPVRDG